MSLADSGVLLLIHQDSAFNLSSKSIILLRVLFTIWPAGPIAPAMPSDSLTHPRVGPEACVSSSLSMILPGWHIIVRNQD